jgi:hypothetical protein
LSRSPVCLSTPCGSERRKSPSSEQSSWVACVKSTTTTAYSGVMRRWGDIRSLHSSSSSAASSFCLISSNILNKTRFKWLFVSSLLRPYIISHNCIYINYLFESDFSC